MVVIQPRKINSKNCGEQHEIFLNGSNHNKAHKFQGFSIFSLNFHA